MNRIKMFSVVMCFPLTVLAWERTMIHLVNPSSLDRLQLQVSIHHRFQGSVDKGFDTFFGLRTGANVGTSIRFAIVRGLEVKTHLFYSRNEYAAGGAYTMDFKKLGIRTQGEILWYTVKDVLEERDHSVFMLVAIQTLPLFRRITLSANLGYDWTGSTGAGFGLDFAVTKRLFLMVEYFPALKTFDELEQNAFAFGIRLNTYGHQFIVQLSNGGRTGGPEIWTRRLMQGAADNTLYFGFSIHRLFDL